MSNKTKYVAFPYTDDSPYDDGGNVSFILLELTPEFTLSLADKAEVIVKALKESHKRGFTLQSLAFWDASPLLIKYDFDDWDERIEFSPAMDDIYDIVEGELDMARDSFVILDLDSSVVNRLPTEWPDYKEMHIDAQGLWVQWEYILDNNAVTRFTWYLKDKYDWILAPVHLTWKQLQEKDNAATS